MLTNASCLVVVLGLDLVSGWFTVMHAQWRQNEYESVGHMSGAGNFVVVAPPPFFGSTSTVQLVVFVSTFVMISTV